MREERSHLCRHIGESSLCYGSRGNIHDTAAPDLFQRTYEKYPSIEAFCMTGLLRNVL